MNSFFSVDRFEAFASTFPWEFSLDSKSTTTLSQDSNCVQLSVMCVLDDQNRLELVLSVKNGEIRKSRQYRTSKTGRYMKSTAARANEKAPTAAILIDLWLCMSVLRVCWFYIVGVVSRCIVRIM
jgi:hypothetical protein